MCLGSRKKLIETVKERLEICSIYLTQHLPISVRRGFCFYDFSKFFRKLWNKKGWNFQYRFAFVGECGCDEGGVSHEFYSGNTMSWELCFKCFPSIYSFHKSNLEKNLLEKFHSSLSDCSKKQKLKIASLCSSSHRTSFNLFWYLSYAIATLTNGLWDSGGVSSTMEC